ncbi:hypothetical protein [Chlorobium phaeovibrioides]|uniref:hypothetical protein n=1 Tax=Chlorobium phaeovibrioides TaxID=1094 RepID=UPI001230EAED|nr:hypothetical protein [Chlorobium phaeovibrioides]QEQ56504.1 hypothetical protein FNV82_01760 [Chlorobium phaeovibrioides]
MKELQSTIAEKEEQIRQRGHQLQHDIEAGISPKEMVKKHPLQSTAIFFVTGLLTGKVLRHLTRRPTTPTATKKTELSQPQAATDSSFSDIRMELLRSAKDLGVSYLQHYIDGKFRTSPKAASSHSEQKP